MRSRQKAVTVGVMVIVLTLIGGSVLVAAALRGSSGRHIAWFSYCETGLCVPLAYWGEATVTATYQPVGTSRRITRIDQTMSLYNARNNNLCNVGVGIVTDVFSERGAYLVQTVPIYRNGSYWIAASTLFVGGYSDVNLTVRNPRIRGRGIAAPQGGATCFGMRAYNFQFDIP